MATRALNTYNSGSRSNLSNNNNRYRQNLQKNDDGENESNFRSTSILIKFSYASLFALGLVLFVIGLLYVTIYGYEYSFTTFSIDLMAGIFITIGFLTGLAGLYGLFRITPFGKPIVVIALTNFTFLAFVLLFVLGVIGLSMNGNGELLTQTRQNMYNVARNYNQMTPYAHDTKKIDWAQRRFACCGIDSYLDWKSIVTFRGSGNAYYGYNSYNNVQYINRNPFEYQNRLPYIDDVPDTCCIHIATNCGKSSYSFGRDRAQVLNARGCLNEYQRWFSRDVVFLCALSVSVSALLLVTSLVQLFLFTLIKRNNNFLIRTYEHEQYERKVLNGSN
jgi:hypothetical protein